VKRFVISTKSEEESIIDKDDTENRFLIPETQKETMKSKEEQKNGINIIHSIAEKVGQVDDSRIVFQELKTGEVPRLYSTLKYDKCRDSGKVISATHTPGSTIGAAALVAGTAIGGGILAAPAAIAPAGFLPSTGALLVAWWYMLVSGLLLSELSINRMGETGKASGGILELYKSGLPPNLSIVATGAYFLLHYAVMVAYFAQGGINLDSYLRSIPSISGIAELPGMGQILFASTIGSTLYVANKENVIKLNNALVLGVLAVFFGILGIGAQTASFSQLFSFDNQHPDQVVNALPILFLSIVYQNVVPTVVSLLEGDRKKIRNALIMGTAAPLFMLIGWNAVILGNVYGISSGITNDLLAGNLDPIHLIQSGGSGGPLLSALVSGFSELAIITSLIGFVYGMTEALGDVAGIPSTGRERDEFKPLLYSGVILPPLLLSVINPNIFYDALDYGGAFGVSTLFLVLPPVMVWKLRYGEEQKQLTTMPMIFGGKITLGALWKAAGTLILEQGAEKLGVFDWIHEHIQLPSF